MEEGLATTLLEKEQAFLEEEVNEQMSEKQLHLLLLRELRSMKKDFNSFKRIVQPIVDAYQTGIRLGKWTMIFFTGVSVILGVLASFRSFFKSHI